ncbi:MAG TPA: NUDIX domain-containing protein [Wenzhouxiangella sp.]|nr:NUDIX domain-containing protein [Wenzhouxiangella sp.]
MSQDCIETVAALIADDSGRVLMVRKHGTDTFIHPGGKRERGEDSLATLARELGEEINVSFDPALAARLGRFEERAVHEPGMRVRAEVFVVAIDGSPRAGAEIAELAWVDPQRPETHRVAPLSRRHVLPAFVARSRECSA